MAQLFCSGPVDVWVGTGGGQTSKSPQFLGHGERAPEVDEVFGWKDVYCDVGGDQEAFDKLYGRSHLEWSVDVVRYNLAVLFGCLGRPNPLSATRGTTPPAGVGTLALTEGASFPVWLRWPYSTKAAMTGLPNGIRMVACVLTGPDRYSLGTDTPLKVRLSGYGMGVYDPSGQGFNVYDGDMSALGSIN